MNDWNSNHHPMPRIHRYLSLVMLAALALTVGVVRAEPAPGAVHPPITVYKTPNCGCCTLWAEHMPVHGFEVDLKSVDETHSLRAQLGIPEK